MTSNRHGWVVLFPSRRQADQRPNVVSLHHPETGSRLFSISVCAAIALMSVGALWSCSPVRIGHGTEAPPVSSLQSSSAQAAQRAHELDAFCRAWMEKLVAREQYNATHIKWGTQFDGIKGEYIAYSSTHSCKVAEGSTVVGKLRYDEIRYGKQGQTLDAAQHVPAVIIERTGVTELFLYQDGKWSY